MYSPEIEMLIDMALTDGSISAAERSVLVKKAVAMGIDQAEFEMVLEARLQRMAASASAMTTTRKVGTARKCPACGAAVSSMTARCSECDHEFQNVGAAASMQGLFDALQQAGGDAEKQAAIIVAYPIPNSRGDLLEFLAHGVPLAKDDDGKIDEVARAWAQKCQQAMAKARVILADDPATMGSVRELASQLESNVRESVAASRRRKAIWIAVAAIMLFMCVILPAIAGFLESMGVIGPRS
jgi:tryptophanyl-tRNA synthetase